MGNIALKVDKNNGIAILNYWRRSDSRKKHIISEAFEKLIKMPEFEELGISRIEIDVADCNLASQKVAECIKTKYQCSQQYSYMVLDASGVEHPGKKYILILGTTKNE